MTPTAQEVAERIVGGHRQYGCYNPVTEKTELTDCGALKGRGICTCGVEQEIQKIVNTLVTFTQACERKVRKVWKEALDLLDGGCFGYVEQSNGDHWIRCRVFVIKEFRRRATQVEGREVE